jgi:HPt (histidine-containing phosphotransfer) domain-containing protein
LAEPPHPGLDAAIAALWHDAQPRALARVQALEEAVGALRAGPLEGDRADRARREAHKLAGALGTFGMPRGTDVARAVEHRLETGAAPNDAVSLAGQVGELRRIVEAGPGPGPEPAG